MLEVGSWFLGLKLCFQFNHVFACRASKKDCTDHVQHAVHKYFEFKKLMGHQRPLNSNYLQVHWL